jgi:hypothetical protein
MKLLFAALMLSTLAHAQVEESKTILTCSLTGLSDGPEYILKADSTLSIHNGAWGSSYTIKDAPAKMVGGLLKRTEVLSMKGEEPVKTESEDKLVRISEKSGKYEILLNISNSISFEGEVLVGGKLVKGGMDIGGDILDELSCSILSQEDFSNLSNL